MTDPLRNPKDPLHNAGPPNARDLFRAMSQIVSGCSNELVIDAALNLLINAVRQEHSTRNGAERSFDNHVGIAKNVLLEQHYDLTGRRRNIFPYTQVIAPELFVARKRR